MKQEIRIDLGMTEQQAALMEMHALINVLNIITAEMDYLQTLLHDPNIFKHELGLLTTCGNALHDVLRRDALLRRIARLLQETEERLPRLAIRKRMAEDQAEVQACIESMMTSIESALSRVQEWQKRQQEPIWYPVRPGMIEQHIVSFLSAVEKHSKGRYGIVYSPAQQGPTDYCVSLDVLAGADGEIAFPALMLDTLRDLVANARKYSDPGTHIRMAVIETVEGLRITVRDEGIGIPPDELQKVFTFGGRASNVGDRRTYAGGFGLTKAYSAICRLGGRIWIDSELGKGTLIEAHIPLPQWRVEVLLERFPDGPPATPPHVAALVR
ncbi:MAG: ATP-binding protein [Verrucomicrobiota bacterium]